MLGMLIVAAVQAVIIAVGVVAFFGLKRQEQARAQERRTATAAPTGL